MTDEPGDNGGISMGEPHDLMTLDWVQSDIEQSLLQAQECLEAYLADNSNTSQLSACYESIHQVHGSLQMASVLSAVTLTEQIEALLNALLEEKITGTEAAHEALAQAFVYLPPYLTRIKEDGGESPQFLVKPINDIRRVLGLDMLADPGDTELSLGSPRPDADASVIERFNANASTKLRKIRQSYQLALIGLIRNEAVQANCKKLGNDAERLQQLCEGAPLQQLWDIAVALLEGLANNAIAFDNIVLELLRKLDGEIKLLIGTGAEGLNRRADETLLKTMLALVVSCDADLPAVQKIKQEYAQQPSSHSDSTLIAGPDRDTINSVVSALVEELARIKDTIDLYVRNEVKGNIDLAGLQPSLKQIASTLLLLDLDEPRQVVQSKIDALMQHSNARTEVPDEVLLEVAEALLHVEAELNNLVEKVNSKSDDSVNAHAVAASEVVVTECLNNLREAKEAINEFVLSNDDFNYLENVPRVLMGAYGGLSMLSLANAAQLVFSVAQFIEDDILAQSKGASEQAIEAVADVVSTVEFFLEGVAKGQTPNTAVLEQAKSKIASIGYPVEQTAGISSEADEFAEPDYIAQDIAASDDDSPDDNYSLDEITDETDNATDSAADSSANSATEATNEDTYGHEETYDHEEIGAKAEESAQDSDQIDEIEFELPTDELVTETFEQDSSAELATSPEEADGFSQADGSSQEDAEGSSQENTEGYFQETAEGSSQETAEGSAQETAEDSFQETADGSAQEAAEDSSQETAEGSSQETADGSSQETADGSLIDDEIFEIFIEEAEEVIETINEYWPQYSQNPSNIDALQETRRGFHTLKGSGRMVSASVIAELAWSVENLLNQVIENVLVINEPIVALVDEVRAQLPVLLEHLKNRTEVTEDVAGLMARAEQLAAGETPSVDPVAVADDTSVVTETLAADQVPTADEVVPTADEVAPTADEVPAVEEAPAVDETPELDEMSRADEPQTDDVDPFVIDIDETSGQVTEPDQAAEAQATLYKIFTREALQHLVVVDQFVSAAAEAVAETETAVEFTDDLYRAFHTLKGSAHMAELQSIAEIAGAGEALIGKQRERGIAADEPVVSLLQRASRLIHENIEQLEEPDIERSNAQAQEFVNAAVALQEQYVEADQVEAGQGTGEPSQQPQLSAEAQFLTQHMDAVCQLAERFEEWRNQPQTDNTAFVALASELADLQAAAEGLDLPPIRQVLDSLGEAYARVQVSNVVIGDQCLAALAEVHEALVSCLDQVAAGQEIQVAPTVLTNLSDALDALEYIEDDIDAQVVETESEPEVSEFEDVQSPVIETKFAEAQVPEAAPEVSDPEVAEHEAIDEAPSPEEIATEVDGIDEIGGVEEVDGVDGVEESIEAATETDPTSQEAVDPELLDIFLEEADEIFETIAQAKQAWLEDAANTNAVTELQRALHTLKGGARMAGISAIGDLSHELESVYENAVAGRVKSSPALFDLIHECDDALMDMLSELRQNATCRSSSALVQKVKHFHAVELGEVEADATDPQDQSVVDQSDNLAFDSTRDVTSSVDSPALDEFFKRADAAVAELQNTVDSAKSKGAKTTKLHAGIKSRLSALQADAYEAGVHEVGDLGQIFQEVIANITPKDLAKKETQTELQEWLERISSSCQEARASTSAPEASFEQPFEPQFEQPEEEPQAAATTKAEQSKAQDNVRVSSGLLEQLVNLAGETSVSRARIEQQVSNFGYGVEEIGATIERLREQLRRLDNETEAQILFRQERDGPAHLGFDPLEMDRYSRMQELSRSLVESVSDLLDLKDTLRDRTRYTENLLLQQSRINTELQEGLMKTRMVPFERMVPRLRRIVRQVSSELDKQVNLTIKNADAELDRSLLEHITAPLEHMLRNAVDHGIETKQERSKAGKKETGDIQLSMGRDGGDIVIELSDDGAGIDVQSVRSKAVERGLISADAAIDDQEVLQFILQSGFSTAAAVTQISGRGVGMDVVGSGIKQMGGSIEIDSVAGEGTKFTVRVPFTVSVNQALMVNVGEESYALPLGSIEGVVRVSPYELEEYYSEGGPGFEYAGQNYDLRYLGSFVGCKQNFQLHNQVAPLPVILLRTGDTKTAIQVDSIAGSREVVVKPLGPQLGTLPGMSGATILADGRVVLILDMAAMIRHDLATASQAEVDAPEQTAAETKASRDNIEVMVVDDSVTVRKVAARLLERQGLGVTVAKDGVEAMTKLQEAVPDIMLLDIEMPRMDGFELASLMRHDDGLKDIPIVMITSRTGQKHRDRAEEIGVNRFMGKPFQEDELLDAIAEFTEFERKQEQNG